MCHTSSFAATAQGCGDLLLGRYLMRQWNSCNSTQSFEAEIMKNLHQMQMPLMTL